MLPGCHPGLGRRHIEFQDWTGLDSQQSTFLDPYHLQADIAVVHAPTMPSLILVVFAIQLALHLISTFGGQGINDLVSVTTTQTR
jgi:hypothetical protein